MSDSTNGGVEITRDERGRWQGKAFGQMVVLVLLILALGGLVVSHSVQMRTYADAESVERRRDHERLTDAVEALIWVNLPEPYKSRVAPPKWLRDKLGASVTP